MGTLIEVLASGLALGAVYALVGLSLNVVYITTRVISFAQGDVGMLVVAGTLYLQQHLSVPLSVLLTLAFIGAAAVAVLVDLVAVRALRTTVGVSSYGWIVSTLGASIVIQNTTASWFGTESQVFPAILPATEVHLAGATFPLDEVLIVVLAALLVFVLAIAVGRTQWGRAARAMSDNREIAAACGVNVGWMRAGVIVIGAVLVGVATTVVAPQTFVNAYMGTQLLLDGMVAIVLGGLGNVRAGLVGGLALGLVNAAAGRWLSSNLVPYVPFFMLLVWLMFGIEIRRAGRNARDWVGRLSAGGVSEQGAR